MRTLDYQSFKNELKTGVSGGYLFCGEEAYLLRHSLAALRRKLFGETGDDSFNHVRLDAASERGFDLEGAVCQLPVFAEKRLVELWGADPAHMKADELRALCEDLSLLPSNPQTVLVMCVTPYELDVSGMPKRPPKALTALGEYLTPVIFARETPAALTKWVAAHFTHEGVNAARETAAALVSRCGSDMSALSGEVAKLCAYVKSQGRDTVTVSDVEALCAANPEIGAFDFSNAVLAGDFERSMFILSDMKRHKGEPVVILSDVMRCFARMQTILALGEDAVSPADIAKRLKMHEYPVRTHLAAAKRLGRARLEKAVELCVEADQKLKFSSLDGFVIISRLLCRLAAL